MTGKETITYDLVSLPMTYNLFFYYLDFHLNALIRIVTVVPGLAHYLVYHIHSLATSPKTVYCLSRNFESPTQIKN